MPFRPQQSASFEFDEVLRKAESFVKEYMAQLDVSHDWLHIQRVRRTGRELLKQYEGQKIQPDSEIVELACLLHDVGDFKYSGSKVAARETLENFFQECGVPNEVAERVITIIENMSFRKELEQLEKGICDTLSGTDDEVQRRLELWVVQDADRLDSIGSIGIARCFSFSAVRNTPLHGDNLDEILDMGIASSDAYNRRTKSRNAHEHFYEKLLHLKKLFKTPKGREMAEERHEMMLSFLKQFEKECYN